MKPSMGKILRKPGTVVCRLPGKKPEWGLFQDPAETLSVLKPGGVLPALKWAQTSLEKGFHVAGFISYEAGSAFDPANRTIGNKGTFPLLWLASYRRFSIFKVPADFKAQTHCVKLSPELTLGEYLADVRKIKKYIYDGETYQVNYTFRVTGKPATDPESLFLGLCSSHPVPYYAYVNTGGIKIISNSPELFIEAVSGKIRSLPMKGTAGRALSYEDDRAAAEQLALDIKNRAENIMIVDMVRNDFGRICVPGSISAAPLFHVDTYPTVHQMVSGVNGKLKDGIGLGEILAATFPPASITGAPKIRAMEIISELESSPRKAYTGTIGCFTPDGDFCLNVAIRTFISSKAKTEMGIGSGIVADSDPKSEWLECLVKSDFATFNAADFHILETILWERDKGFAYMDDHLERARNSQSYFGGNWKEGGVRRTLSRLEELLLKKKIRHARVRLLISKDGRAKTEYAPLEKAGWDKQKLILKVSDKRIQSNNVFLYHKTTNRGLYDAELQKARSEGYDEVLFLNDRGEVTEGAITNIFISGKDGWVTPPVKCGLLPGIWRKKMICELRAKEKVLALEDLKSADKILIGNSVRGSSPAAIARSCEI